MKLIAFLFLTLASTALASSEESDPTVIMYSELLAKLVPTKHEKICLTHESEMALCTSEEFTLKFNEAIVACVMGKMDAMGSMEITEYVTVKGQSKVGLFPY